MKIGIAGYRGRVGQLLVKELQSGHWPALQLAGGSSRSVSTEHFPVFTHVHELMEASECVIDFTAPDATLSHLDAAVHHARPMVIGTTGLDYGHEEKIRAASAHIPIVYAANMSIGITLLLALVEQAAAKLGHGWDIEIHETHHRNKVDSPSGTALALGKSAQSGRGEASFVHNRAGARKAGDIGFAVSRGGDVVGEHMVMFYGMGERVELGHRATDRTLFARGALQAALWLSGKPAGLYSMRDVLSL